ncbi:MAG: Uma2 family endonuclease [Phormidesmis sp.]
MTFITDLQALASLTDQQFYDLCQAHPDVKFERTPGGYLLIMPPTGGETGNRNFEIGLDLGNWNRRTQLGVLFDSSTGFSLPGGGDRAPDLAFVRQSRWDALSPAEKEKFPPIAPDFVLELMSPSDVLIEAQAKMSEYLGSGVRLGWLINRQQRRVWIYRPEATAEVLDNPSALSGEDVLPDFTLNLKNVW